MSKIIVVGIGPGDKKYITAAALEKIKAAKFLVGGRRSLAEFSTENQITFPITADLVSAVEFIKTKLEISDVVVMVSGDPGYYSFLPYLKKNIATADFEVIPSISSIQLAFAKLCLSWESATLLSFHGRKPSDIELNFVEGKVLGLLTDAEFNSASVAKILIEHGWRVDTKIAICSRLSYADENIEITTLGEVTKAVANCVLIVNFFDNL